jgi:hypothetical protein
LIPELKNLKIVYNAINGKSGLYCTLKKSAGRIPAHPRKCELSRCPVPRTMERWAPAAALPGHGDRTALTRRRGRPRSVFSCPVLLAILQQVKSSSPILYPNGGFSRWSEPFIVATVEGCGLRKKQPIQKKGRRVLTPSLCG